MSKQVGNLAWLVLVNCAVNIWICLGVCVCVGEGGGIHILAILGAGEDADIFIYTVLRHTQCSQSPLYKFLWTFQIFLFKLIFHIAYQLKPHDKLHGHSKNNTYVLYQINLRPMNFTILLRKLLWRQRKWFRVNLPMWKSWWRCALPNMVNAHK